MTTLQLPHPTFESLPLPAEGVAARGLAQTVRSGFGRSSAAYISHQNQSNGRKRQNRAPATNVAVMLMEPTESDRPELGSKVGPTKTIAQPMPGPRVSAERAIALQTHTRSARADTPRVAPGEPGACQVRGCVHLCDTIPHSKESIYRSNNGIRLPTLRVDRYLSGGERNVFDEQSRAFRFTFFFSPPGRENVCARASTLASSDDSCILEKASGGRARKKTRKFKNRTKITCPVIVSPIGVNKATHGHPRTIAENDMDHPNQGTDLGSATARDRTTNQVPRETLPGVSTPDGDRGLPPTSTNQPTPPAVCAGADRRSSRDQDGEDHGQEQDSLEHHISCLEREIGSGHAGIGAEDEEAQNWTVGGERDRSRVRERATEILNLISSLTREDPEISIADIGRHCRALGYTSDEVGYGISDAMDLGTFSHSKQKSGGRVETTDPHDGLTTPTTSVVTTSLIRTPPSSAHLGGTGSRSGLTDIMPGMNVGHDRTRQWVDTVTTPAPHHTGQPLEREETDDLVGSPFGPPSLASTPKRSGDNVLDDSHDGELLRGPPTGPMNNDLQPDRSQASQGGHTAGADKNNNTRNNPFDGTQAEADADVSSIFGSPDVTSGSNAASTPKGRSRTKSNWDDTDEEELGRNRDRSRSQDGRGTSSQRKKRSQVQAQRQRRAREKLMQAARRAEEEAASHAGAKGHPQPAPPTTGGAPARNIEQPTQRPLQQQPATHLPQQQHQQAPPLPPPPPPTTANNTGGPQVHRPSNRALPFLMERDEEMPPAPEAPVPSNAPMLPVPTGPGGTIAHPTTCQGLTPEFVKLISDDVNRCCAGGNGEFFDPDEEGIFTVEHEFDWDEEDETMDTTVDLDTTRTFQVRDLVSSGMEVTEGAQVRSRDIIPYVVLKWDEAKDTHWSVPSTSLFHGLVNRIESRIQRDDLTCGSVMKWSNLWGKVGLLGLSARDPSLLSAFRTLVESQVNGSIRFSIYPRDGLDKKGNVSVLLRETYRDFDIGVLAKTILRRTRKLKGGLRVTHIKEYGDNERSRTGASKAGWRLVLLQGTPEFMASLEQFEAEHRFWVGSDRIIIRGGNRKASGTQGPGQVARQRGGQRQQHQQQAMGGHNATRSRNRSYDQSYPAGPGRHDESGRGRGRAGSGPASGSRVPSAWGEAPPRHRGQSR